MARTPHPKRWTLTHFTYYSTPTGDPSASCVKTPPSAPTTAASVTARSSGKTPSVSTFSKAIINTMYSICLDVFLRVLWRSSF
ncbi:ORFL184C.iORF3 [Human betaherpesvirus 5]|nr:ORFL184C.iORF3 [Human betaherpesvirus 5]QHX40529.1 ORFL184C.iORF3 [Human betaherpesvirus 5]